MPLHTLTVKTHQRREILDLTPHIRQLVRDAARSGFADGLVIVFVPHTTAAVTINENADPDVKHDLLEKLGHLIPQRETYYRHAEGNSDSHLMTALTGNSALLLVDQGELVLGTWQGLYFCEFDGPRTRQVHVKLMPG